MGPDWFTVVAQIVNFLILLALLKRFLYGPIVRAMDRRETAIATRMEAADKRIDEAEQERVRYEKLARELAEARDELLFKARKEAEDLRKTLLEKAREEVGLSRAKWHEALRSERESLSRSLRRQVREEVCKVSRRVLREISDSSLEERIALCLERRIGNLGGEELEELARHFRASSRDIVVRSAFEMDHNAREAMIRVVRTLCDSAIPLFEKDPSMVCGIEVSAGGRSLSWNFEHHLEMLEEKLVEAMESSPPSIQGRSTEES